jgi:hypothetical protein
MGIQLRFTIKYRAIIMSPVTVILKQGDDPLKMDFVEPRPNYLKMFIVGALIFLSTCGCCTIPILWLRMQG